MDKNLIFILKVIAAVIDGRELPKVQSDIDWKIVFNLCQQHNITSIVAHGIVSKEYTNVPPEVKKAFSDTLFLNIVKDEKQKNEIKRISQAFTNEKLKFMPLKGIILKSIYPSSDMRTMGDIDILVDIDSMQKYCKVMENLGYTFVKDKENEVSYKNTSALIELHRYLITPGNDDMFSYYETGWNIAKQSEDSECKYILGKEDEFVYLICHFVKHYRNAGCGIKPLIDMWLYMNKFELDMNYINTQLEKMNLLKFVDNLYRLIRVWFEDEPWDELMVEMTNYIVASAEFGNTLNQAAAESLRDKAENKKQAKIFIYLSRIFLNKKGMKIKYPILNKLPFLLPVMWVWRIIETIIFKRNKIAENRQAVNNRMGENVDRLSKHMDMVGLDIYNGRKNK